MKVAGSIALVTGANRGLGLAFAKAFEKLSDRVDDVDVWAESGGNRHRLRQYLVRNCAPELRPIATDVCCSNWSDPHYVTTIPVGGYVVP